jgi:hypothetical protein
LLWWPTGEIAGGGDGNGERTKREERKKERKKEESGRNIMDPKGASLTGALLWSKDASEGGALLPTMARTGLPRLHPRALVRVAPSYAPRASDTLVPYSSIQIWNIFPRGSICKNYFPKGLK